MISSVTGRKSWFILLTLNASLHLHIFSILQGVHLFVTVHPKADANSTAITVMIQKTQYAAAGHNVIGDFNHFNFQKDLEQFLSACHLSHMAL